MNQRSIGIEHLNSTGAPTWLVDEKTYQNSAKLIADICKRYKIPCDRQHIIGHKEVPTATACPGGLDVDRLVRMAKDILNGVKKQPSVKPTAKFRVETINRKTGDFAIRMSDINSPSGIKRVLFPTWTENKGQDDIKWNEAVRQKDGTWLFVDSYKKHGNEVGKYIVHAYIETPDGAKHYIGANEFKLVDNSQGKLEVTNVTKDSFTVTLSGINTPYDLKGVKFPTWTTNKGQDDIVWYQGSKHSDGTYSVTIYNKDHKNELGEFTVHCYGEPTLGWYTFFNGLKVDFKGTEPQVTGKKPKVILVTTDDVEFETKVVSQEEFNKLDK